MMSVDWNDVRHAIFPIKDYEDLCRRMQRSFSLPFICDTFNFTMPALKDYTLAALGGDPRGRYAEYAERMIGILSELEHTGVPDLQTLVSSVDSHDKLPSFSGATGVSASGIGSLLKYLVYWFIPGEKYLSTLVRDDPESQEAVEVLKGISVRTNLEILQRGINAKGRRALANESGQPEGMITSLVNRADLSRLPWSSKATISNIIGAGYGSLAQLAGADPETLFADFFRYGKSIGKNLKHGNEIENSYRIARIVPVILK